MTVRSLIERIALITIGALLWRCWCLQGALVPNRVDSGSMAPFLLGVHRQVTCADCGCGFPCGSEAGIPSGRAVCPNCGYAENQVDDLFDLAGDGLLLDRLAYSIRRPRRWEVVAFRHPEHADQVCVKRVVGLPGEQVEIRRGDVYVNGRIQRKTLDEQRRMAVAVYDASHPPTLRPTPPSRWSATD
ncbi:MAG: signal peptidase I, partial [Patescibacteria group bacterium]|nr:signal peptidase I [Patescibacteria group bacterium]